jgi:hypothetical protein
LLQTSSNTYTSAACSALFTEIAMAKKLIITDCAMCFFQQLVEVRTIEGKKEDHVCNALHKAKLDVTDWVEKKTIHPDCPLEDDK